MSESDASERKQIHPFLFSFKSPEKRNVVHIFQDRGGPVDPQQAGMFLVDLARHYARMFAQVGASANAEVALDEMRQSFDAEWNSPTDLGEGGIPN